MLEKKKGDSERRSPLIRGGFCFWKNTRVGLCVYLRDWKIGSARNFNPTRSKRSSLPPISFRLWRSANGIYKQPHAKAQRRKDLVRLINFFAPSRLCVRLVFVSSIYLRITSRGPETRLLFVPVLREGNSDRSAPKAEPFRNRELR